MARSRRSAKMGRALWVRWVLANAGGVVLAAVGASILAFALGTYLGTVASTHYFDWVFAFLLGTMQWLILGQRGFRFSPWVVTTVGGALLKRTFPSRVRWLAVSWV